VLLLHLPAGGVEAILDTVVQQLLDNPDRTFVYADLAFFIKWWQELHEDTKAVVRSLVQQGRFEFTNGGIVQHDEATSHYSGMVDQMSLGMRFLQAEFGQTPKIAWQVWSTGLLQHSPAIEMATQAERIYLKCACSNSPGCLTKWSQQNGRVQERVGQPLRKWFPVSALQMARIQQHLYSHHC
jgi:hypothetical protein